MIFGPVVIIAAISVCYVLIWWVTQIFLSSRIIWNVFRLEKEYTTIKTKEMEEQVEIKVRGDCWERCPVGSTVRILFRCDFDASCFAEATDGEPAPEAKDRHARESECVSVCHRCSVTRQTDQTLLPAHQHYINPFSCVCSYIMHLLLMVESRLSLTRLC